MSSEKWMDALTSGDEVIVWEYSRRSVGKVQKRDKVKILVGCGGHVDAFSARNGRLLGSSGWTSRYLVEATPDLLAKTRDEQTRRACIARVENVGRSLDALSTEVLQEIDALIATRLTEAERSVPHSPHSDTPRKP